MKKKKVSVVVGDYFWVLGVFIRGKLLRQKGYRPQSITGKMLCFHGPRMRGLNGLTGGRLNILIRWWGLRLMTLEEIKAIKKASTSVQNARYPPYLQWEDDKWSLRSYWPNRTSFDKSHRIDRFPK